MLTYDVRVYSIETRPDRPKPYRVRWLVGPQKHSKSYTLKAQADGRRSELMTALRKGDQFDVETGLPTSELRALHGSVTWYEHTRAYVDRRWDRLPAKSRRNDADALATITPALVKTTVVSRPLARSAPPCTGGRTTRAAGIRSTPRRSRTRCAGWRRTPYPSRRWKTPGRSGWRWTLCRHCLMAPLRPDVRPTASGPASVTYSGSRWNGGTSAFP